MDNTKPLSDDLLKLKKEIRQYAVDYGLSFYEVEFEVCDYDTVNILAAQGGFPTRYPHWRFGMEYDQFSKGYAYGVQKIYEMVINTNPCYAYLLNANHTVDQKIVMAHVYGHADFFKNNSWFSNTNRKMMDVMANHRTKIRRYMEKYGADEVELFIDKILSLENLLDITDLFETREVQRHRQEIDMIASDEKNKTFADDRSEALRSFMKSSYTEQQKKSKKDKIKNKEKEKSQMTEEERERAEADEYAAEHNKHKDSVDDPTKNAAILKVLPRPQRDIMKFLAEHAPITEWQSDVISILREEAYYYLPQRVTKIMNEGWASYWHSRIMTEKSLEASEITDFADHHAGVMQTSRKNLNPYKLGIELFRDIEYRWNTGKFGKEYNECDDIHQKENWDLKLGKGREKIFEVRKGHNDISFIDEYLTQEFCNRNQMFTYKFNPRTNRFEIDTRDFLAIKMKLLSGLTNYGSPVIEVEDANFSNRGELLLAHRHYGVDLDLNYAHDTMKNIWAVWKRPVNLKTKYDNKEIIFIFDGKELRPVA
ncbi:MAG: SpoVR family protein [Oligoflexia bacterium]|nr:SpoVR family protein [Oligoflexia bacterium]